MKPVKAVGEQLTTGEFAAVTAPETAIVRLNAGELAKVILPLRELPLAAEAGIRTETVPPTAGRLSEPE